MRNKHPGVCYRCNQWCAAGDGHFELLGRSWRVQHATCAIENRGKPDAARVAQSNVEMLRRAAGTGKGAQRARRSLRDNSAAPQ